MYSPIIQVHRPWTLLFHIVKHIRVPYLSVLEVCSRVTTRRYTNPRLPLPLLYLA